MPILSERVWSALSLVLGLYQVILQPSTTPPAASTVDVTIPLITPSAAVSVAPDLVSLSIEQDRWDFWAGTTKRNDFFYNALDNSTCYHVKYKEAIFPARSRRTPYPEAANITVGQGFYDIISHLPSGTRVQWGVNLREYNLTAAYLETKALIQAFGSLAVKSKGITLNLIEVGNEANLYRGGGRYKSWNVTEYVSQWVQFATNVSETAGLSKSFVTKLIGGAFSGSSHNNTDGFSPQALFAHNILKTSPGALITTYVSHFDNATFSHGLEYVLGETNSMTCHGSPGVSNTAGAALWALDYSLFATQVGISRLPFHQGVGYKYNFVSVAIQRDILTLCRASIDLARDSRLLYLEWLSDHSTSSPYTTTILRGDHCRGSDRLDWFRKDFEINVNATDISGYAVFEDGRLARAVFVNMVAYLPGGGVRDATHIDINLSSTGVATQKMEVKRLSIPYANAASGITWGGQTYETPDARVSGKLQVETLDVSAGLDITETEAVLVSFL